MKILVTGANGFVGRNLSEALKNIRDGKDRTHPDISIREIFLFDVNSNEEELEIYCKEADFVFNLAGVNRPKEENEYMKGNCDFLSHLLDTLKRNDNYCPVMLSSSIQASLEGRYAESEYGKSKKASEDLLFNYSKKTGVRVLIYRFANIFGKWCRPNYNSVVATYCYNIANERPIIVNDDNTLLDIIYIDDLIDEMLRALTGNETRVNNYCMVPIHYETTLGNIASILNGFPKYGINHETPNLGNPLTKKLYSTWLSYLPSEKMIYNLKMNCDNRGSFTEILRTGDQGQFSISISKPGCTRGNHWHNSKCEKFVVVKGMALIRLRKVGENDNGEKYPVIEFKVSGDRLQVVEMLPGYSHSILNLSMTEELITFIWANEKFNPEKPDTYSELV